MLLRFLALLALWQLRVVCLDHVLFPLLCCQSFLLCCHIFVLKEKNCLCRFSINVLNSIVA